MWRGGEIHGQTGAGLFRSSFNSKPFQDPSYGTVERGSGDNPRFKVFLKLTSTLFWKFNSVPRAKLHVSNEMVNCKSHRE